MKRPNGTGGVRKLSGRRRNPYQAVVSAGHVIRDNKVCVKQVSLGCYPTRREALLALAEWQTSHARADLRHMTVKDVWDKVYPDLKDSMKRIFSPFFERYALLHEKRLVDVKTCDIEQIPLPPYSKSAHEKIRAMWHRIFEYGIANDIVTKDYSVYLKFQDTTPKRKKEVFSDLNVFLEIPLYRFLLYTGMRINELLSMKTSQVYEEEGILCFHITESKTEAGKRIIPVHSELMPYLDLSQEYVIEPHRTYSPVRAEFLDICKKNNISGHTLHDFRRTFASYEKSCGADDYYIKRLMGHISDDITKDVYTQAFVSDLKKNIELLDYCNTLCNIPTDI